MSGYCTIPKLSEIEAFIINETNVNLPGVYVQTVLALESGKPLLQKVILKQPKGPVTIKANLAGIVKLSEDKDAIYMIYTSIGTEPVITVMPNDDVTVSSGDT